MDAIPGSLSELLTRVAAMREAKERAAAELKEVNRELERLERLASESLAVSGLDGCRVAGRTWWTQENLLVSVNKDQRDAVLEAARQEGIAEEITTVATATLKSWLRERAQRENKPSGVPFAAGTAFDGLISECVEVELRSRTSG